MRESLLLIPDITGFTEFINRTEISHSQHIISELLDILIQEQYLNMEIAEIEGDAILFYKENPEMEIDVILQQTEIMFLKFHRHLKYYEQYRICNCGACSTATNLSLKFVVHKSEIGFITVNEARKPFGHGLITVHRILKNKIQSPEYVLFTESLFQSIEKYKKTNPADLVFYEGSDHYKTIGVVIYKYIDYSPLLKKVGEVGPPNLSEHSSNPVIFSGLIKRPIDEVYEKLINLDHRHKWQAGINDLIYEKNRVNRVGTKHICIYNSNQIEFETVRRKGENRTMIYGEKMQHVFFNRAINIYYTLENRNNETWIKIEIHFEPKPMWGQLLLPLMKLLSKQELKKSFESLKRYCEKNADPT
jgi:hypothetical protein